MLMPGDLASELRRHYLFASMHEADLAEVAGSVRVESLDKGQRLFDQDDPAQRFFLVRSGQVKLYRLSPDGQEKIIEIMGPGKTFAEAVMFMERHTYPVYAEALGPVVALSVDNTAFLGVLRRSADTCLRVMADMSMHLHARVTEIDNLCLHNATYRLVTYLLEQVPDEGQDTSQIHLSVAKGVLAARLSIQRETFSRILARLRELSLIDVSGQDIVVTDLPALRALVQE